MSDRRVNITFEGKVVGWAEVAADNKLIEFEVDAEDMKRMFPSENTTEELSVAFKHEFSRQNPTSQLIHVPGPWEEPDWDAEAAEAMADLEALYNKYRPKGTFDA